MQAEENTLEKSLCETEVEIKNADGLHMRPAMQFVDIANQFECDIPSAIRKILLTARVLCR